MIGLGKHGERGPQDLTGTRSTRPMIVRFLYPQRLVTILVTAVTLMGSGSRSAAAQEFEAHEIYLR